MKWATKRILALATCTVLALAAIPAVRVAAANEIELDVSEGDIQIDSSTYIYKGTSQSYNFTSDTFRLYGDNPACTVAIDHNTTVAIANETEIKDLTITAGATLIPEGLFTAQTLTLPGGDLTVQNNDSAAIDADLDMTSAVMIKKGMGRLALRGGGQIGVLSIEGGTLAIEQKLTTGSLNAGANTTLELPTGSGPMIDIASNGGTIYSSAVLNLTGLSQAPQNKIYSLGSGSGAIGTLSQFQFRPALPGHLVAEPISSLSDFEIITSLAWNSTDANVAHGTFYIPGGGSFTVLDSLYDKSPVVGTGWDGTTLTKRGGGELVLADTSTYSGGTRVEAGTLVTNSTDALGSGPVEIANGAKVTVTGNSAEDFGNNVTGDGRLHLNTASLMFASGDLSGFGGVLRTEGSGTLLLDTARIGGDVEVASGTNFGLAKTVKVDGALTVEGALLALNEYFPLEADSASLANGSNLFVDASGQSAGVYRLMKTTGGITADPASINLTVGNNSTGSEAIALSDDGNELLLYLGVPVPVAHSITVTGGRGGQAHANRTTAPQNATITLTATPESDHRFDRWEIVPSTVSISGDSFLMPDEPVTVTAHFLPRSPTDPHVTLAPDPMELRPGETGTATISLGHSGAKATARSDNPAVADVQGGADTTTDGHAFPIRANSPGTAVVMVTFYDATGAMLHTAPFAVTVKADTSGSGSSRRRSSGGSSGSDGFATALPTTNTVGAADMRALIAQAKAAGRETVRASSPLPTIVRAEAWRELPAGRPFAARTTVGNAVQVQLTFAEPHTLTETLWLSAYVKGDAVEKRAAFFKQRYTNDFRVIHFEHTGKFPQPVEVAAKVDLTGLDAENLVLYRHDSKTNTVQALVNAAPWVDKNGYLHFTTQYGGDILVFDGRPVRK